MVADPLLLGGGIYIIFPHPVPARNPPAKLRGALLLPYLLHPVPPQGLCVRMLRWSALGVGFALEPGIAQAAVHTAPTKYAWRRLCMHGGGQNELRVDYVRTVRDA